MTSTPQHARRATADRAAAGFRPDIQGLRALAVSMVVLYHLRPGLLPGGFAGVDVFFVISGFLITGHLARTVARSGRVGLADFWGRRARRLLPAAALVLAVTWIAARLVLPATQLPATAEQVRASALYVQNWVLAHDAVDYLTSADAPSPVQHFWSLSVEEQFYLLWPLLFVLAALVAVRAGRRAGRLTASALALVVVGLSLAWSAHLTATDPAAAYFVTTTRLWELAAGGAVALLPGRVGRRLARVGMLGWLGLALVVVSAFALSGSTAFPGTAALLPVAGAALAVLSGSGAAHAGPGRLTSARPLVFLGDISYSLYLWHWPVIVCWTAYRGGGIGLLDGPAIVAVSIGLAWLTKIAVEDPVRRARLVVRSPVRSLATALSVLVPVGLVALYTPPAQFHGHLDRTHAGAAVLAERAAPAAAARTAGAARAASPANTTPVASLHPIPPVAQAPQDFDPYKQCETPPSGSEQRVCTYGDRRTATLTVALIGDSVANQFRAILADAARRQHWFVVSDLHSQCAWTATMLAQYKSDRAYTSCHDWGVDVLHDMRTRWHPDVVVTTEHPVLGTVRHPAVDSTAYAQIADGMLSYWQALAADGTRVVAVRPTPNPGFDVPSCLSRHGATPADCTVPAAKAVARDTAEEQAVRRMPQRAELIDLTSLICTDRCAPIVGNVVVYRDSHHLTQTFISSLEPAFLRRLLATRAMSA